MVGIMKEIGTKIENVIICWGREGEGSIFLSPKAAASPS